jgi:cytochrome c553
LRWDEIFIAVATLPKVWPLAWPATAPTAGGIPAQYPRLAGQFAEYTEAQMKAFRTGERANDANKVMRSIAAKMSDDEIHMVADYIAGLP